MALTTANLTAITADLHGEFDSTSGTYAQGGTSQTLQGILVARTLEPDPDRGLDAADAQVIVLAAQFTTVAQPRIGDTWTVTGQEAFEVNGVLKRVAHYVLRLTRRVRRGADVE